MFGTAVLITLLLHVFFCTLLSKQELQQFFFSENSHGPVWFYTDVIKSFMSFIFCTHTHKCCNSDYCLYPCMCVCVCVCVCYEGIRFVTCSWVFIYFQGKHGKSGQWENWYKWCVQVSWWKQDFLLFNCIVWLSFSVCYVFPSYMVHPFVMLMCTSLESNAVLCLLL